MFDFKKYSELLCSVESNCKSIKNSIGALGLYQFMPATLNNLKQKYNLPDWKDSITFLSDKQMQNLYLKYLVQDTLDYIKQNDLEKFINIPVSGSMRFKGITAKLNLYGMVAAAHLSGVGNLKRFLSNGYNPNDGFTSLSDYAAFFSQNLSSSIFPLALAFIPAIVLYFT